MRIVSQSIQPVLVCLLVGLSLQNSPAEADWPQWRGPQRDDISPDTGLLSTWPTEGPPRAWLFENCGVGYSGPAVVDGRLYVMGGRDGKSQLICLDANDGNELWHVDLSSVFENGWGDGPRSTPTVDGDFIYAMTSEGDLSCVSLQDKRVVWQASMTELGGEVPTWGFAESPLIYQDMVICTPGGPDGTFAAFDKKTGKVLWRSEEISDMAHYSSIVLMKVAGRTTGVQLLEKQVVGFSLDDGSKLWSHPWPGRVAVIPTPIVNGQEVYVCSGYGAGSMKLSIGDDFSVEKDYDNKVMVNHHGGVILLDGYLYGHSDRKGWTCQDFATGDYVWRDKNVLSKGAIGYADGHFYCLSEKEGKVVMIAASTEGWQEKGRFTLDPQTELRKPRGRIWVHPVIVGGRLYLRDQDLVYCYDLKPKSFADNSSESKIRLGSATRVLGD